MFFDLMERVADGLIAVARYEYELGETIAHRLGVEKSTVLLCVVAVILAFQEVSYFVSPILFALANAIAFIVLGPQMAIMVMMVVMVFERMDRRSNKR